MKLDPGFKVSLSYLSESQTVSERRRRKRKKKNKPRFHMKQMKC